MSLTPLQAQKYVWDGIRNLIAAVKAAPDNEEIISEATNELVNSVASLVLAVRLSDKVRPTRASNFRAENRRESLTPDPTTS